MDENPLLSDTLFPRFDAVEASHVVPGIRYVLAESERELEELEKSLEGLGEAVTVSFLLPALERLTGECESAGEARLAHILTYSNTQIVWARRGAYAHI